VDERSMVYVIGAYSEPQAIIFIGFDPAIHLKGLIKWGKLCRNRSKEGLNIDSNTIGYISDKIMPEKVLYIAINK
jgi:pyruvate-formate lyase-activating enzyme